MVVHIFVNMAGGVPSVGNVMEVNIVNTIKDGPLARNVTVAVFVITTKYGVCAVDVVLKFVTDVVSEMQRKETFLLN